MKKNKNVATLMVDKAAKKSLKLTSTLLHMRDAFKKWTVHADMKNTQEVMNAARSYRRQLRKRAKGAKRATKRGTRKAA